jgi:hypothetical protein
MSQQLGLPGIGQDEPLVFADVNVGAFVRAHFGRRNAIGIRFYQERKKPHDLFFVWFGGRWRSTRFDRRWNDEGSANALLGDHSSTNWTKIPPEFIRTRCRRIKVDEVLRRIEQDRSLVILLDRAAWMDHEMRTKGEAVLPFDDLFKRSAA